MKRDQPEGEQTPIESKPKTIFILRDFAQTEIEETLEQAQGLPDYHVEIPGLGTKEEQGLVFRNYVRAGSATRKPTKPRRTLRLPRRHQLR